MVKFPLASVVVEWSDTVDVPTAAVMVAVRAIGVTPSFS
jgi:hypothetical protein